MAGRHLWCAWLAAAVMMGCGRREPEPAAVATAPVTPPEIQITDQPFEPSVQSEPYGQTPQAERVERFYLTNRDGIRAEIINFGATVTALAVPDRDGKIGTVTLGFDDLNGYLTNSPYFGTVCGRYANRIAGGKFSVDGQE